MANFQPVQLFNQGSVEERGENARMSNFVGAIALTDLMRTTLGPKGMDKILQSMGHNGEITVTNDGATILKAINVDNAAAKVLVDISKTQDEEVGDGTTSVCVLAGELLREAEKLIEVNIHPQTIVEGYNLAASIARNRLAEIAECNGDNPEKFKQDLLNIAKTTLSSKVVRNEKEHFAALCVDAILRLKGSKNLDAIHIIKKPGGSLIESKLEEGFILEKRIGVGCPKRIENAKILIANTAMDTDKIKVFGAKVRTDSVDVVAEIEDVEKQRMWTKTQKIADHGINCFINRQLIYNLPEEFFASKGIMSIEHADFDGIERLALVLGGDIVSTFDHPEQVKLGHCDLIEEDMIGEDKVIRFSGVALGEACTIVLRGATAQLLDEVERSIHDALCVVSQTVGETRIVYGGGCSEIELALAVDQAAQKTAGKKALALEAYARALRQIPSIISDNGGYDSAQLVSQLRAAHASGNLSMGLDMNNGKIGCMKELCITESFKVKNQVIISASEAAEMILRVDQIFKSAPRERSQDPRYG
mmetsp:Transcript_123844/g.185091  ORF Transcript_123844/g.185091 Transcript_123844/m.185091 type:complete len:534 (-) Transcript_123844:30-1631(-)|eukprot:CAMPEP_0117045938 /NCGR_PEP_ID=MMETSP0472-20121206/31776_1 /TAXON_ID=693140 ORGANISM="Tiarina fusus, Strain LIS" /NCGR_SAMPLE_ID=MMETSP0472 /ASSEMBLY_ACC=CAM_ASM_000603 /LENGTH=533 /DNA_ID=CAMNT_0004758123 /DNA_START=23 /DNA_END=1624 /DNA_ORIENTATION=+